MRRCNLPIFLVLALGCRSGKISSDSSGTSAVIDSDGPADTAGTGDTAIADPDVDLDGYPDSEDCDDTDAEVNPGADELCDGVDNDCDGVVDESDAIDGQRWYLDQDADGYGDVREVVIACDAPSGYVAQSAEGFDCDDTDADFHPGADESDCTDPSDYNCDGSVGYADADGDGWAACAECDDLDAEVHPDASEFCDAIDNDCNGLVDDEDEGLDEETASDWYVDLDGDGYGDESVSTRACDGPEGHVEESAEGFDCDDSDPDFHPGAPEWDCADAHDYNCDGSVAYEDGDGDGWAACEECNDADAAVHPDAIEVCNGIDDDCDLDTDDADSSLAGAPVWFIDHDSDGYGSDDYTTTACEAPAGWVDDDTDCDDTRSAVHPHAAEICDGLDNDCDESVDDSDSDVVDAPIWYTDADGDGYGDRTTGVASCEPALDGILDATDCDDDDADIHPLAFEVCDGLDNDCNGDVDADDAGVRDASLFYLDVDGDGYGDSATVYIDCWAASGSTADASDCDDSDAGIHPAATEVCDGQDNDCNDLVDDDDLGLVEAPTWYTDADGDGYGDATAGFSACEAGSDGVVDATDCADSDPEIHPGADEICDGLDNDCDGDVDADDPSVTETSTYYLDADGDGLGDITTAFLSCASDPSAIVESSDCDDTDPSVTYCQSCTEILSEGKSIGDGVYTIALVGGAASVYCEMSTDGGGWTLVEWVNYDHHRTSLAVSPESLPTRSTHAKMSDENIRALGNRGRQQALIDNVEGTQYLLGFSSSTWSSMSSVGWENHSFTSYTSGGSGTTCNGHRNNRGFSTYSDIHLRSCPTTYSGDPLYMTTWHTHESEDGVGGEYGVYVR